MIVQLCGIFIHYQISKEKLRMLLTTSFYRKNDKISEIPYTYRRKIAAKLQQKTTKCKNQKTTTPLYEQKCG